METEVKFRMVGGDNPLMLVPVFVNSQGPYEFVLDTGAAMSLLTPELADRLKVRLDETKDAYGAGGKICVSMGCVEALTVGEARAERLPLAVTDALYRIAAIVGAEIHGNLGYDFLKRFRMGIDYRNGVLRLSEGQVDLESAACLPFTMGSGAKPLIQLPVFINGTGPYRFVLDTGASTTVLSPRIAEKLGIELQETDPMHGAGGKVAASFGTVDSLCVGDCEVRNLTIAVADFMEMLSRLCEVELEGVLGYNFLREFHVTIDYPNTLLLLEVPCGLSG